MDLSLKKRIDAAYELAEDELKLDPGNVRFVVVPPNVIYEAASTGLPGHWQHWSYGRDYWIEKGQADAGLTKIYEIVFRSDPSLALLSDSNSEINNLAVACHVFGHTHLNRNNVWFRDGEDKMLETIRTWTNRIEEYEDKYGDLEVERFIDKVLSLEPFADPKYEGKRYREETPQAKPLAAEMDDQPEEASKYFEPVEDLYGFLADYGEKLEDWQRDILQIYRKRSIYFAPMRRTKILHEGFASMVHSNLMKLVETQDHEWVDYSDMSSGVVSPHPGRLNPYWFGYQILSDIAKRDGWEAMLEVVGEESDESLVRNHLTPDLADELELFRFSFNRANKSWIVDQDGLEFEQVRDAMALKFGSRSPRLQILDYDYHGRRILRLKHLHDGRNLDMEQADKALCAVADLWGHRVQLETKMERGECIALADPGDTESDWKWQ